jgi:hypothetical protein
VAALLSRFLQPAPHLGPSAVITLAVVKHHVVFRAQRALWYCLQLAPPSARSQKTCLVARSTCREEGPPAELVVARGVLADELGSALPGSGVAYERDCGGPDLAAAITAREIQPQALRDRRLAGYLCGYRPVPGSVDKVMHGR